MIKKYVKDDSFDPIYNQKSWKFWTRTQVVPNLILLVGLGVLTSQVIYPLVYFKTETVTISPSANGSVLGIASGFNEFNFIELNPATEKTNTSTPTSNYFYINIPKLGIDNAAVETHSPSLNPDRALGHYAGSAIPGQTGNAFIYGHSVLPFFYNPKNYKTIFSTLDQLKVGDVFTVIVEGKKLTYIVESKTIMEPEKVDPLAKLKPDYLNESTITLMTCTPPGTKDKRLLVNAVLQK